eukprot:Nitzschia sp. Nitz4//scaffold22_size323478//209815//210345//NITZ4_000558-RA/size323478-processed-gene-0.414-mRNA-1//1//CDS//3329543088//1434//frame0
MEESHLEAMNFSKSPSLPSLECVSVTGSSNRSIDTQNSAKQVSFDYKCRVRLTDHLDDYSDHEYYNCWYTPEEKDAIRTELTEAIARSENEEEADGYYTPWGLETHTEDGRKRKGSRRSEAIKKVVEIYDAEGAPCEKAVAELYRESNYCSRIQAYYRGLENQSLAKAHLNDAGSS